jgi:FMN phosphatase YigB (HAD superfamily)
MDLKIGLLSDIWTPYYIGVEQAIPNVVTAADAVILSCLSGRRKPDLHNFELVCSELNLAPEELIMVGDTYTHDIAPAIETGMKTIWVLARPDREKQALLEILNGTSPAPSITVDDISCVPDAVKNLMH